ncbi:hypothetical protein DSO57_1004841 [Entomophthora muscae]|uniref:Uncharacterized protein n=1 Tax=Entomophthora muscae TaxID=34485 RepID=A0ACC2S9Y8_9FUNG|nr:hypothetical protein DSO57_1004841 [Entomophthora muscae]
MACDFGSVPAGTKMVYCQEREWTPAMWGRWYTTSLFSGSPPVKDKPQQAPTKPTTTNVFHPLATAFLLS